MEKIEKKNGNTPNTPMMNHFAQRPDTTSKKHPKLFFLTVNSPILHWALEQLPVT